MLDRARRLHLEKDFQRVWRGGSVRRGQYCIVRRLPRGVGPTRFGFVVSKTVAKRATERNRIKRRLRAAVRGIDLDAPTDIVIYGTRSATTAPYLALVTDLRQLLSNHAPTPHRRH